MITKLVKKTGLTAGMFVKVIVAVTNCFDHTTVSYQRVVCALRLGGGNNRLS